MTVILNISRVFEVPSSQSDLLLYEFKEIQYKNRIVFAKAKVFFADGIIANTHVSNTDKLKNSMFQSVYPQQYFFKFADIVSFLQLNSMLRFNLFTRIIYQFIYIVIKTFKFFGLDLAETWNIYVMKHILSFCIRICNLVRH